MKTFTHKLLLIAVTVLFYDIAVGGLHLALISHLSSLFYWPIYAYFETGFLSCDVATVILGIAIVLILSIGFVKKQLQSLTNWYWQANI